MNQQNARADRPVLSLADLRSLSPQDYREISQEGRKRLLTHLVSTGGAGVPDFLRDHLRLFSQAGDVAAGPTLDVRDAKLRTSIQGALGLISEKLKELGEKEPKAAPPRPVGGGTRSSSSEERRGSLRD